MDSNPFIECEHARSEEELESVIINQIGVKKIPVDDDGHVNPFDVAKIIIPILRNIKLPQKPENMRQFVKSKCHDIVHFFWWLHAEGEREFTSKDVVEALFLYAISEPPIAHNCK